MPGWANHFDTFLAVLQNGFLNELPGPEAQYKMVPPGRPRPNFLAIKKQNPRLAGVLALFYPVKNAPHIVLIKRHSYPGVHSNQIGLPGGKVEPIDQSITETALRETEEEIGVPRHQIQLLNQLTQVFIPPSNFLVQPMVGVCSVKPQFIPDNFEVKELIELPVKNLFFNAFVPELRVEARGQNLNVPAYKINNQVIWGATAMMLAEIEAVIKLGET